MVIYPPKKSGKYTCGGKALGLLKLLEFKDITVPDFLIIPAENFDAIINNNSNDIQKTKEQLASFSFPVKTVHQLKEIIAQWQKTNKYVIVRSSIADEDGQQDAFAGIMESYSGLNDIDQILEAVNKCAISAFSDQALSYRQQKKITSAIRPAVIIQQQINAEVSGVIFSTYPAFPFVMAINAVWGMGEGLVNGDLSADEYFIDKSSGKDDFINIVEKDQQVAPASTSSLKFIEVSQDLKMIACINQPQRQSIFKIASFLESNFSKPLDIEFVIEKDKIYIVQARPITQVIPQALVYDNSNIQESFSGVTSMLTFSFAQRAYATVYRQTMQLLSLPPKTLLQYEPVINNLLAMEKGRVFYNINNWYKGLLLLPSFKQNKEDMERMMGLEDPVAFIVDTQKSVFAKLLSIPRVLFNLSKLLFAFAQLKKSITIFLNHFNSVYHTFYHSSKIYQSAAEIIKAKEFLDHHLLENWTTPIINDFYLMMMNGKVRRRLVYLGFSNPDDFLSRYFAGNQQVESAIQAFEMQKLAKKALKDKSLTAFLISDQDDIHQLVKNQHLQYYQLVENFIENYGDRTVGELKLETITMRLNPAIFYSYLRNYLLNPQILYEEFPSYLHQEAKQELALKQLRKSFGYKRTTEKLLNNLQQAIQNREAMRLQRTKLFGMYRSLYLAGADILLKNNLIDSHRDVFHLRESEFFEALSHKLPHLKSLIDNRKIEFEENKKVDVPSRIFFPPAPYKKEDENLTPSQLNGTGCVAGSLTAEIIVISSPEDDLNVNGKIICALRTDPGWVALFPACKGVLIEKGSPLSHSVILLREFGIPTIINIKGLTKRLISGDTVKIDGTTGEIEIVDDRSNSK